MITIRRNTFETNSSSTHSLIMCTKSDYKLWEDSDNLYLNRREIRNDSEFKNKKFVTYDELLDIVAKSTCYSEYVDKLNKVKDLDKEKFEEYLYEVGFFTSDMFYDYIAEFGYEDFYNEFNDVIAFGYYGANY